MKTNYIFLIITCILGFIMFVCGCIASSNLSSMCNKKDVISGIRSIINLGVVLMIIPFVYFMCNRNCGNLNLNKIKESVGDKIMNNGLLFFMLLFIFIISIIMIAVSNSIINKLDDDKTNICNTDNVKNSVNAVFVIGLITLLSTIGYFLYEIYIFSSQNKTIQKHYKNIKEKVKEKVKNYKK